MNKIGRNRKAGLIIEIVVYVGVPINGLDSRSMHVSRLYTYSLASGDLFVPVSGEDSASNFRDHKIGDKANNRLSSWQTPTLPAVATSRAILFPFHGVR